MVTIIREVLAPTPADLTRARDLVTRSLAPTALLVPGPGSELFLKAETFQPTGAFKVRGALAAVGAASIDRPVITASAGNHDLGVAYAASLLGRQAIIVTAENASAAKADAIRRFPVELVQTGSSFDDAEAYALDRAADGATYISAYNDPNVIAGQATIGAELDRQMTGSYTVTAGHQVDVHIGPSIADVMAGNIEAGSITIELIREHVDQLLTVTENEIRTVIRYLALHRGIIAEGAGAVATAAVLTGRISGPTVAIVSGRNITAHLLEEILRD